MNDFKYSFDNKRYHTYNYYLKTTYNSKVAKIILDAGFTCPNRDGKKSYGGCIFCSSCGSGDTNKYSKENIINQYENNKKVMINKWNTNKFIPYFQSFSNTYGPLSKIKEMIEPFINNDEVVEISLATRCDCLEDDVIEYLNSLTSIKPIWLELGLQSSNEETAKYINRGHSFIEFKEALNKLSKTNIKICVHIMNGLPNETKEDMLKTIKDIKDLKFDAIKFHMLNVLKNTKLGNDYLEKPFKLLTKEEYIDIIISQIRLLKPEVIIERLTSDPIKEDLIEPKWVLDKKTILNDIDKKMKALNAIQGDLLNKDLRM